MTDRHVREVTERAIERLKVEVDACHAALRTLVQAIPTCECEGTWSDGSCVHCNLEYEIGIAENILNNPICGHPKTDIRYSINGQPDGCVSCAIETIPELCSPILTKARVLEV